MRRYSGLAIIAVGQEGAGALDTDSVRVRPLYLHLIDQSLASGSLVRLPHDRASLSWTARTAVGHRHQVIVRVVQH